MNERITFVSLFDDKNLKKIKKYINILPNTICKVPYGKNVDNRLLADTLPYHFTIFSWNINKEEEVLKFLNNKKMKSFKVLVSDIMIVKGNENSFDLRFNIEKCKELYELQKDLSHEFATKYYNPDLFNFHITIDISKDKNKIENEYNLIKKEFSPFELEVTELALFEIYPAKLIKIYK